MADPRTLERLRDLDIAPGPLVVCDVDEVVLAFLDPLRAFLASHDMQLVPRSFRLHGNVLGLNGHQIGTDRVSELIDEFFATQDRWQSLVPGAREGLATLADHAAVILLTAMRHGHFDVRQRHLAALGLDFPLVTTEGSKGLAIAALRPSTPIIFIDDLPSNHVEVLGAVDRVTAIHFMADDEFAPLLPELAPEVSRAHSWDEVVDLALAAVDRHSHGVAARPERR